MREIVLVSAFFDIKRNEFTFYKRDAKKYFEQFKFWASMKNQLIVFTTKEYENKILEIRSNFGLKNKTKVIVVNDIFSIDEKLYNRMQKIQNNIDFLEFRYNENSEWPENKADYNYIMFLKYWCLKESKKYLNELNVNVCWIDFGFNHGGSFYPNSSEFNFKWEYDFPSDKITMFYKDNPDENSIINVLQFMNVTFMGFLVVSPSELLDTLWNLIVDSMESLLNLEVMDDDQLLLLISYKMLKSKFNIIQSDWFLPLKQCGGSHLTSNVNYQVENLTMKEHLYLIKKNNYFLKRQKLLLRKYIGGK